MSDLPAAPSEVPEDMKTCSKCKIEQPRAQFYAHPNTADGVGAWCKPCYAAKYAEEKDVRAARKKVRREADLEGARAYSRAANKKHYAANRERITAKRYGISPEQYVEMVSRSKGRCAICDELPDSSGLCVDHDHSTGMVRGLLCGNCNRALGKFRDSTDRLRAAVAYLEKSQTDGSSSGSPHDGLEPQAVMQVNPEQEG